MNNLLDTNILLTYVRDKIARTNIEKAYQLFDSSNTPIISIVTVGEIKSIAKRNYWGQKKLELLDKILSQLIIIDINAEDIIEKYAEIDAYSQGKLKNKPLPMTSRNMGKNDLWIAATASVTNATLITTDKDFNHLDNIYLKLISIESLV